MDSLFSNLSQMQINGLILLVVSLPLLAWSLWNLHLSVRSKTWPKVKGKILEVPITKRPYILKYQYMVGGKTYEHTRIFFTNSIEWERRAKSMRKIYKEGQAVEVFYDFNNYKRAVLQPGRKDGLITSILFLTVFILIGGTAYYNPYIIQKFISSIF